MMLFFNSANAALISRTIVNDGDMGDWYDTNGNTYDPTGDITNNTGQFSTDLLNNAGDLDSPLKSTGRDLKKFSYTWDATNIYLYVERWASSTNVTDWWFYLDTDADGLMETGEIVFRVKWQGSNRSTVTTFWDYTESAAGGDPMVSPGTGFGDGYTMPGIVTLNIGLLGYSSSGGASSGTEMESYISWSKLGFAAPGNVGFHISSSNGSNLPKNIIDNMDGPAGGELFPDDLEVTKTADASSVYGGDTFTYTVSVYNGATIAFTSVEITDVIPSIVNYVSHSAPAGTTYTDTDADSRPDLWSIPSIDPLETLTLTITVAGGNVTATMPATTATLTASVPVDEVPGNDFDSVDVEIKPNPLLVMVKTADPLTVNPGGAVIYTLDISNIGAAIAKEVIITDVLGEFTAFGVNTYGAGIPFEFTEGSPASGLSIYKTSYSNDGGSMWNYLLDSGGGGASAGYDANVTNFKIEMTGDMDATGGAFSIDYEVIVEQILGIRLSTQVCKQVRANPAWANTQVRPYGVYEF